MPYNISKEQIRILRELDVDAALKYAAKQGFIPDTREIALAGIHKARLGTKKLWSKQELNKSKQWLLDNGYTQDFM